MPRSDADLRSIHRFCTRNRDLLARAELAGCFYCESEFAASEVSDWVDLPARVEASDARVDRGETALCPRCGIDSVLPSSAPFAWDDQLLPEMHQYWFGRSGAVEVDA